MGWRDFFKGKKEDKVEEEVRSITFSESKKLIDEELLKNKKIIEKAVEEAKESVGNFVLELNKRISLLNSIDLKDKKERERLKLINLQNLRDYINQLTRLAGRLEKWNSTKDIGHFGQIDLIISDFLKGSRRNLHLATILIGDEIAETEKIIKDFHKEVDEIAKENIDFIIKVKKIEGLISLQKSFDDLRKSKKESRNLVLQLEESKKKILKELKEKEKELNLFRESKEFREWIDKKKEFEEHGEFLNREGIKLREEIDVKSILKKFHGVKSAENLLKGYRENFMKALKSDEDLEIMEFIESNKREVLEKKIKSLREKILDLKKESDNFSFNEKEDLLENSSRKLSVDLSNVNESIFEENRKLKRFEEKEKIVFDELKEKIEGILEGVVVESVK